MGFKENLISTLQSNYSLSSLRAPCRADMFLSSGRECKLPRDHTKGIYLAVTMCLTRHGLRYSPVSKQP